MNPDEIGLYNTLMRLNTNRQNIEAVRPYAERFMTHSNIQNKRLARATQLKKR